MHLSHLRWLGVAFCVLAMLCSTTQASALARATTNDRVSATITTTTTTSASAHGQTKTRVGGFEQKSPLHVCSLRSATVEQHRAISSAPCETASAFSHAAEGGGVAADVNLFQAYRAELSQLEIEGADAVGSALKSDPFHMAPSFVTGDIASSGQVFTIPGASGPANLTQMLGEVNGIGGRFEWIVNAQGNLTHQMFVPGGVINGIPIVAW